MFAVTGMTGQVGAAVADHLLKNGAKVRAVVRNPEKGRRLERAGLRDRCRRYERRCIADISVQRRGRCFSRHPTAF